MGKFKDLLSHVHLYGPSLCVEFCKLTRAIAEWKERDLMRKILTLLFAAALSAGLAGQASADLVTVDFETPGGFTTSIAEATDGFTDYFTTSDGSNIAGVYNTPQGNSFFAAQDTDADEIGASPASLFINDIVITDFTDLNVQLLVAEDDDGTNQDWDASDAFEIFASIDGGPSTLVFSIRNDGSPFNAEPLVDTDLDGIGDGTAITDTFADFTASIAGTGDELDLEFRFSLDSGDEDLAIDNIRINGTAVPEPSSIALLGLVGLVGFVRRRK